jgi:hypothetical protein
MSKTTWKPFNLDEFWAEKIRWAQQGDRTDEGHPVIRLRTESDGIDHFVANPYAWVDEPMMGHGGGLFVFGQLYSVEDPIVSNNVWCQGDVPPEYYESLPVNAVNFSCMCGRWWIPRRLDFTVTNRDILFGREFDPEPCYRCVIIRDFAQKNRPGGSL